MNFKWSWKWPPSASAKKLKLDTYACLSPQKWNTDAEACLFINMSILRTWRSGPGKPKKEAALEGDKNKYCNCRLAADCALQCFSWWLLAVQRILLHATLMSNDNGKCIYTVVLSKACRFGIENVMKHLGITPGKFMIRHGKICHKRMTVCRKQAKQESKGEKGTQIN